MPTVPHAAHRLLAALLWIAISGAVHAQPAAVSSEQRPAIALISVLGLQVQVVERRAPGSVWFSYRRRALANAGETLDAAVLRGLEAAVAQMAPSTQMVRVPLAMRPSALWRWRGAPDSPLANVLDQVASNPARGEWNEMLLVVPLLIEQPVGVPPVRRGAGIFTDVPRGPEVSGDATNEGGKVSVHLNARVWRLSAKTLIPIGSEDVVTSARLVEQNPDRTAHARDRSDAAALQRLEDLVEHSIQSAAARLLQSDGGAPPSRGVSSFATSTGRGSAKTEKASTGQAFPVVEVTGRRAACPALQWDWYDALAVAYEQRIYGSGVVIPTRFYEAMRKAGAISREALALGCLVPITADCAEDTAGGDRVRADSGDSWRERDVPEELLARGIDFAFLQEKLPYFSRPERCRL